MKILNRCLALILISLAAFSAKAATSYTLNPLFNFGSTAVPSRNDGSIQPGDTLGNNPVTGNTIIISAPTVNFFQPGELAYDNRTGGGSCTNGFNMRGLTYDPTSGNVIFVDTHEGSGGSQTNFPWTAIYILDGDTGAIKAVLNTNGIGGGSYTMVVPGVSDDGVVYVCNQTTASQNNALKIYRWDTAATNNANFGQPPVLAYSGYISNNIGTTFERLGQTMDVRGSGPNTQIILGSSSLNGQGLSEYLFVTADGTNFTPRRIYFTNGITAPVFNDGIAFGPGNTFFAKQVNKPLLYVAYNTDDLASGTNQIGAVIISSFTASGPNDPLLNLSAIAYDPVHQLFAGLEEIGGTATGGRGKVWLFHFPDPTNHAPAVLSSRTYVPNFQKTTAPMGYLRFRFGTNLYAHASNNGLLCSSVDSVGLNPPTFTQNLLSSTRIRDAQNAHFEVTAVADVTNYQWFSNNVAIPGANSYYYDIPSVTVGMSGNFYVIAYNAAGSAQSTTSTLTVITASQFFHPTLLWGTNANTLALSDTHNFITSGGGSGAPNERCIAYNALSNQLLVARGPSVANLKIMVVDADQGTNGYLYTLKNTGIGNQQNVTLVGIAVADDGAVYAAGAGADNRFAVYRWANTDPNTFPITIFGTNSTYTNVSPQYPYNPIGDLVSGTMYRWGDTMTVRGSGTSTEILLDAQNSTKFVSILTPLDSGMTNWTETGYLLQNILGSYGCEAYGTTIGRSVQFGPGNTFYQKRYNAAAGAPLAKMSYNPGGGFGALSVAVTSPGLFTNGAVAVNSALGVAAGINFCASPGADSTSLQDTLSYYDISDPSQTVLLSTQPIPQGNLSGGTYFHKGNGNAVGQVIFGQNITTGTNYIFVIDGNNGVAAYTLSGGTIPPPKIIVQPRNLRVLQASSGGIGVTVDQIAAVRWFKGTNPPVDTGTNGVSYTINNAALSDAGDYFCIASNVNGMATSTVAHVTVALPDDNYTLQTVWGTAGAAGSYITADGGPNTPNERSFAYNALSNQLIIVRCPPSITSYTVAVVSATSGVFQYAMSTTGVEHQGASEVSGSNPIDLVGAAASDDGSIYVASESPNASGGGSADYTKMLKIYRWTNSSATTPAVLVWVGDPSAQSAGINLRWGDALAARGSGTNTELFLNSQDSTYAAVLKPKDPSLNAFTNITAFAAGAAYWPDAGSGGSIGRSVQFGATNSVYEKRKNGSLIWSTYDPTTIPGTASVINTADFTTTLGGVAVDTAHNLAIGVDFVGATGASPDAVSVYDISDWGSPMLIKSYNFPANQVPNANVICQTIISGNRVWAMDANNGIMFLNVVPPANSMKLNIAPNGSSSVKLSWGNKDAILQSSPSLSPQAWTDIAGPGVTNSVQSATSGAVYRLIQRL